MVVKPYLLTLDRCTESGGFKEARFFISCCIRSTFICEFKFDRQISSGANDQTTDLQFAACRTMVGNMF